MVFTRGVAFTNTVKKEAYLKDMMSTYTKDFLSLDEYLRKLKNISENFLAINKPMTDLDKVYDLADGLGPKYKDFQMAMITNPPYLTFNYFVLALQGHEKKHDC